MKRIGVNTPTNPKDGLTGNTLVEYGHTPLFISK